MSKQQKGIDTDLVPVPSKEMGTALIDAALEKRRRQISDKCVDTVNNLIGCIEHAKERIRLDESALRIYQSRLEAIRKGREPCLE